MEENLNPWRNDKTKAHPWHSMCSYLGAFPPALAAYFIDNYTDQGDIVYDPFSGRGTTLLEAKLRGRHALASDLNPIALALSKAKNHNLEKEVLLKRIDQLEKRYDSALYLPEAKSQSDNIHLIFNPKTLAQLCYLKRKLLKSDEPVDEFLVGATLGILHGGERKDGTSGYASISMPNTFSMSPEYVRKFVQQKQLNREFRDVFRILRDKVERLYVGHNGVPGFGQVVEQDVRLCSENENFKEYENKISLILTSPPYLGIVNYAKQNWIRSWFLDEDPEVVHEKLDDDLNLAEWINFSKEFLEQLKNFMKKDGVAVFVIGDVAKSKTSVIPLAREFTMMVKENKIFQNIWVVSDRIADSGKTTRIWGDTKGAATAIDRIVILSDANPFSKEDDTPRIEVDYEKLMQSTTEFIGQTNF